MSGPSKSGIEPEQCEPGSWAAESLPMAVRKELLERELRKRGFRKSEARTAGVPQQQQQQQPIKKVHPQADADADPHGD